MTELPNQMMLDNDALNDLQSHKNRLFAMGESSTKIKLTGRQYSEFTSGIANLPQDRRDEILKQIDLVEEVIDLELSGVETSGYDEAYDINYDGATGEIYKELIEPHPQIGKVHRPDASGAEAAINRDMPFVTGDKALQKKMRHCGYDEYLLSLTMLRELLDNQSV